MQRVTVGSLNKKVRCPSSIKSDFSTKRYLQYMFWEGLQVSNNLCHIALISHYAVQIISTVK